MDESQLFAGFEWLKWIPIVILVLGLAKPLSKGLFMLFRSLYQLIKPKYVAHERKRFSPDLPSSMILLAYYTRDATIQSLAKRQIGDMQVNSLLTYNEYSSSLVTNVHLPFQTKVHMLAIPVVDGIAQLNPLEDNSVMEKVDLEGDYSSYFSLFADRDQQALVRYFLDPAAMAHTIDFCRNYSWEIVGTELFIVREDSGQADSKLLDESIRDFIAELRPAIEVPLTDEQKDARLQFGEDNRPSLPCPICSKDMDNTGSFFLCPSGHGILVRGNKLTKIRDKELAIDITSQDKISKREHKLTCPSCEHEMVPVAYSGGKTMIDSCANCSYRWLDDGDLGI